MARPPCIDHLFAPSADHPGIPLAALDVLTQLTIIVFPERDSPPTLPRMSFTTRRVGADDRSLRRRRRLATFVLTLARIAKLTLAWYTHWKQRKEEKKQEEKHVTIFRRIAIVLLSILLGLVVLAGVVKALVATHVIGLQTLFTVAGKELPVDENGYTNFLLLGKGDDAHDGVDLTDSMMVASLDPRKTKSAVLMSLPRDLYILHPTNMAHGRINELYRDYKIQLRRTRGLSVPEASQLALRELGDELGRHLGIPIHRVVMVDFIAFANVIDALGGIDIDVPEDLVDTQYPGPNYTYETFAIAAGMHHLDGETALKYARSRHSTSDFDRSMRQQQILKALSEKVKSSGVVSSPSKLLALWNIVSQHAETTMPLGEILGAAQMGERIERDRVVSVQLNNASGEDNGPTVPGGLLYNPPRDLFGGASVLLPISIPPFPITWKQVQLFSMFLVRNRAMYLSHPQLAILNAGARSGLGHLLGKELTRFDFPIDHIANAPQGKRAQSIVLAKSEEDRTIATFFGTLLHLPVDIAPPDFPSDDLRQVTILLGKDYQYHPLQDLLPAL